MVISSRTVISFLIGIASVIALLLLVLIGILLSLPQIPPQRVAEVGPSAFGYLVFWAWIAFVCGSIAASIRSFVIDNWWWRIGSGASLMFAADGQRRPLSARHNTIAVPGIGGKWLKVGDKVLLAAGMGYTASVAIYFLGLPVSDYDYLPTELNRTWGPYDYACLILLVLAVACTIAGVRLNLAEPDSD